MNHTIIIPVYNTEQYLAKCLDTLFHDISLLRENNISIIAVNDGSTDDSLNILKEYKDKYNDLIKIICQENQGLSVARNTAIKYLNTNSFSFLDSDDWLDVKKFINVLNKFQQENLDLIVFNLDYYNENSVKTGVREKQPTTYDKVLAGIEHLKNGYQPSSVCLMIFKTSFVKQNNLYYYPGITSQDVEYSFRFFLISKKIMFIDNVVYHYFRRSGSSSKPTTTHKIERYINDSIIVAREMKNNLLSDNNKGFKEIIEKNYNSVVWNVLWRFYRNKNEVSYEFKTKCIQEMSEKGLYPIKGKLKTPFQNISRLLMNNSFVLNHFIIKK